MQHTHAPLVQSAKERLKSTKFELLYWYVTGPAVQYAVGKVCVFHLETRMAVAHQVLEQCPDAPCRNHILAGPPLEAGGLGAFVTWPLSIPSPCSTHGFLCLCPSCACTKLSRGQASRLDGHGMTTQCAMEHQGLMTICEALAGYCLIAHVHAVSHSQNPPQTVGLSLECRWPHPQLPLLFSCEITGEVAPIQF